MKLNKSYPQITLFILTFVYSTIHSGPTKTENCPKPILDREWQITTNLETEFDQNQFCGYVHEIGSEDSEFHSFLIERHGKIVTEVYNTRADHPFNKRYGTRFPFDGETQFDSNTLHDVRSVSKTVVSLLFGIAIDKKIIDGVDVPVVSYYPELQIPKNDPKQIITWKYLLTMSSGLDWEEWRYGFLFSDETRLLWKKDLTQFFFDSDLIHTPGTIFNYNGGGTSVLSDILTKKTNKSLKELAKEWLFTPLEIHNFEWVEDRNGRALAHAGLRLRPRDMLKLGRLVLNGGNWKGKQIVSKQWLDDSLKKQINSQVKYSVRMENHYFTDTNGGLEKPFWKRKKFRGQLHLGMVGNSFSPSQVWIWSLLQPPVVMVIQPPSKGYWRQSKGF
ncbi:serine hydrolase domain-containing protein [Leptospira levettii]|uniref:serine hydrolase domain-containing protein n=2 Tax=Leptospira levettii TaxID=2023178 RepID=UPI001FAEADBB|nr:serine hydrolase [Leptospira levettii]